MDIDADKLHWIYKKLFTIRSFEERIKKIAKEKSVPGYLHTCIGSEAICVGVMAALGDDDWISSTYRNHGHSIAKKLKKLGAKVIGTDIKDDKKNPYISLFVKLDLDHKLQVDELIMTLKKKLKRIDVLINNAAYVGTSEIDKKNSKRYFYNEKYSNLNLNNTIYLTNSLIPLLKKSKSASIINICSIYSSLAYDYSLYKETKMKTPLAYGVSKAGLMHYTKMLSTAVAPKIRVNSISPGGIFRNQPKKFIKR